MPTRIRANVRSLTEAMCHSAMIEKNSGWPEKYYWQAVWWRLHAKESKNKNEAVLFSRNLVKLMHDIRLRKNYYLCKPKNVSDWQWSGLFNK